MGALLIPFMIVFGIAGLLAMAFLTPVFNRFFSLLWEDPTERERRKILKRLQELHVDGNVPEETAVLMASSEFHTSVENVLEAVGVLSIGEVKGILTGRRGGLGIIADKLAKHVRSKGGK